MELEEREEAGTVEGRAAHILRKIRFRASGAERRGPVLDPAP